MKILWLYRYAEAYNFDKWFHLDYARYMKRYPNLELQAYGPELETKYSDLICLPYSPAVTMEMLHQKFPFDVIICNTKSRMFNYYYPEKPDELQAHWLPKDFKTCSYPKVMIEEDYHYEQDDSWYKDVGFRLILQRHYANAQKPHTVNVKWHPFSVDPNIFKPNPIVPRINKICLAGHTTHEIYIYRRMVLDTLKQEQYFMAFSETRRKVFDEYVRCLQEYRCHVSGSSIYKINPAKMFEIMASGSLLFTNEDDGYGLTQLFPDNCYVSFKAEPGDILRKARQIIGDKERTSRIAREGALYVRKHHIHMVRTEQLVKILEEEVLQK